MAPFRTRTTDTAQLAHAALAEHTLLASYMDSVDAAATQPPACASHEPPGGAGWFESSWELAHGLQVLEGPPLDGPATEWIGAACGLDGAGPVASQRAMLGRCAHTASPSSITAIA